VFCSTPYASEKRFQHMLEKVGVETRTINLRNLSYRIRLISLRPEARPEAKTILRTYSKLSEKIKFVLPTLGLGYHESITPSVIKRIFLKSGMVYRIHALPAEIAGKGRLEAFVWNLNHDSC